jgi:uncharacterized protein DUF4388
LASVQHILVCAQDSVLAKKVRFLLARDECDVEILSKPSQLERRLRDKGIALLILSRSLDGDDAVDILARFDPSLRVPPTIVLGGQPTLTAEFINVVPDPIDTQAIYRIASEVLSAANGSGVPDASTFSEDEDLTHLSIGPPKNPTISSKNAGIGDDSHVAPTSIDETTGETRADDMHFTDVTGLDEIAGQLDQLENADANLKDAFDVGAKPVQPPSAPGQRGRANPMKQQHQHQEPPVLGGLLEPARFAKVLYQCWAKQTTGALIVARDHETLTIHFENGSPVHVESSIPGDQLGRSLVNRGRITEAQYADGAKRAIERGLKLGQALVELAFFTNQELGRELGTTARDQIVGCFAARQGAFEFDPKRKVPTDERPYQLSVGHILAEGIRRHGDEAVLKEINTEIDTRYFKLLKPADELAKRYPLEPKELAFMEFSGRAYNVSDAADVSGLDLINAHKLMALLITCEEVQDFTPGVKEFEARIAEERLRQKELEARSRPVEEKPSPVLPPRHEDKRLEAPRRPAEEFRALADRRPFQSGPAPSDDVIPPGLRKIPSSISYSDSAVPGGAAPPPALPSATYAAPPPPSSVPPTNGDASVPPMPVPGNGEGTVPRPLVYAKPLPRGADGVPLETQERTLSREHFQRGVTLLGQGNFASAEEAFRDAVALCSEEHVYLIGLARAIYYNPGYRADGKVPVLKAIVGRAEQLAPDDNRVATLSQWIANAEQQLRA